MAVSPTDILGRRRSARFRFSVQLATKFLKYRRGKGKIKRKRRH